MPSVWDEALDDWPKDQPVKLFESFAKYRQETAFPETRTLTALSIQDWDGLPSVLKQQNCTVVRLGRGRFALLRLEDAGRLRSLFLFDADLFERPARDMEPLNLEQLGVYSLVNKHSETNLINLALASGALAEALELDAVRSFPPAATAQSAFSFKLRPISDWPVVLDHLQGQVEVDAMFVASLRGRLSLFDAGSPIVRSS